ncbi:Uncharacterised protein [Bacillus freudenreichii]|nr:Uncharacterised protein [Bacillus freudenreichii]
MQLDNSDFNEIKDKEVRECLLIGDKHKTSAGEGVLCLQKRLAYDLEPMALAAGQHGDECRLRPPHSVALAGSERDILSLRLP